MVYHDTEAELFHVEKSEKSEKAMLMGDAPEAAQRRWRGQVR